jgi:hypothetical protein
MDGELTVLVGADNPTRRVLLRRTLWTVWRARRRGAEQNRVLLVSLMFR